MRPRSFLYLGLMAMGVAWLGIIMALVALTPKLPSWEKVRQQAAASDIILLDRHGEIIQEMRVDKTRRRLPWTSLDQVNKLLPSMLVSIEDHRFYSHPGVDMLAATANALRFATAQEARGTSTISMQVVDMIQGQRRPHQSPMAKLRQALGALALERQWSKSQILEAYLNLAHFRGELQGIAAAARGLFKKAPHGLDSEESLLLVTLLRSPSASPIAIAQRACTLAQNLHLTARCERLHTLALQHLTGPFTLGDRVNLAPELARSFARQHTARQLTTSLDRSLQTFIREKMEDQLASLSQENVHEAAVLVLDNASGEVLAYVGNPGSRFSQYPYVDGVQARRQAGSTLKPFLYTAALNRHLITAETLLDDSPLLIPVGQYLYRPRNYDQSFHGPVTARVALASSLNVPAVRVLQYVGVDAFVDDLQAFGIPVPHSPDYYGPALALGSLEVSLWHLTQAYRTLARGGQRSEISWLKLPRKIWPDAADPGATWIIQKILADRDSRALSFGLENVLATRYWSAVKTGTSKDMRDNWCMGFSSRYTVGVWVGNFNGEPMRDVSGITGAGPLWLAVMNYLHAATPSLAPTPPPNVVVRQLQAGSRHYESWFLAGTELETAEEAVPFAGKSRIRYPVHGMVIALDPDIPADRQHLFLEAEDSPRQLHWVLDGKNLPLGTRSVPLVKLSPGRHELGLSEEGLGVVDHLQFSLSARAQPSH